MRPQTKTILFTALGFFALTFAVYGQSVVHNGFFILDDGLLIYENNAIREISFHTLGAIFSSYDPELYIPLTLLSYQIDYLIAGYSPWIYHLTNLILHTGNALLVMWLIHVILGAVEGWCEKPRERLLASILCGMLFAIHPLQTEAVAWAASRKDVLSTFFFLISLLMYFTYVQSINTKNESTKKSINKSVINGGQRFFVLSLSSFALALLSKVTVAILPLILLAVDWMQERHWNRRVILEKIPYFTLSALFGLIALGGKTTVLDDTTLSEKALLAVKSTSHFLIKFFVPVNLNIYYPELHAIGFLQPMILFSAALIAALVFAAYRMRKSAPLFLFGLVFFFITLAPSFFTISKGGNIFLTSDRYVYMPLIGILIMCVGLHIKSRSKIFNFPCLAGRQELSTFNFPLSTFHFLPAVAPKGAKAGPFSILTLLLLIITFAGMTHSSSLLWGNPEALHKRSIRLYPAFSMHYIGLGSIQRSLGKRADAIASYERAIELNEMPNTYALIGQIHAELGDYGTAVEFFRKGLALNPNDSELHYGLGQVYALRALTESDDERTQSLEDAMREYTIALDLQPEEESVYRRLSRRISTRRDRVYWRMGLLYGEFGEHRSALEYYEKALEENPDFSEAHYNLAVALGHLGEWNDALHHYQETVRLDPTHVMARVNLAILLGRKGQRDEARREFENVLRYDPGNTAAKEALKKLNLSTYQTYQTFEPALPCFDSISLRSA